MQTTNIPWNITNQFFNVEKRCVFCEVEITYVFLNKFHLLLFFYRNIFYTYLE